MPPTLRTPNWWEWHPWDTTSRYGVGVCLRERWWVVISQLPRPPRGKALPKSRWIHENPLSQWIWPPYVRRPPSPRDVRSSSRACSGYSFTRDKKGVRLPLRHRSVRRCSAARCWIFWSYVWSAVTSQIFWASSCPMRKIRPRAWRTSLTDAKPSIIAMNRQAGCRLREEFDVRCDARSAIVSLPLLLKRWHP